MVPQEPQKKLRVGVELVGAGEVAQVIHLPTLALLNQLYSVVSICDISKQTVDHVAAKFDIPHKAITPPETISHPQFVMILTADEFHEPLCISALRAGKLVFIEKPITLSIPSVERILKAEKLAGGNKIFVGYMRRYAPSFTQAFLREVVSIPRILHARVRDIVGPNAHFVSQSGTSPVKFTDFPSEALAEWKVSLENLFSEAFPGQVITKREVDYCRFLSSLGSHDLSLMREALGPPPSVAGLSANEPFYSAIFIYKNKNREQFAVTYESGIDSVPRFDASLAVYGEKKTVSIKYDTPYKGLPIKVMANELNELGEGSSREILSSYEHVYTVELKEVYECFVEGKAIKTSAADASSELLLYDTMYKQLAKQ